MAVYYIGSYDIIDPNEFQKYPPLVLALLPKYGGVVLASDAAGVLVEGTARTMNAIIRFPSKRAVLDLYNDPDYQEAKRIRQTSTRNVSMVVVDEFEAVDFFSLLAAPSRAPEIPESADVYGWLCGSWELDVLCYDRISTVGRALKGEVHAARVLEGRAVQDVWIMPRHEDRRADSDTTMTMYGTTLRSWDASLQAWRIAWTNPVSGHREEQVGRWNGANILQEGTRANGTKTRWTFTDITPDSFHWRGEALDPGKDTWTLEGEFLAKRRRS